MKITAVKTCILAAPMPKPWRIGNAVLDRAYATLVEVETDAGIAGVGEAITRLGPGVAKSVVDEILAPCLVGSDPLNIEGLWERMFSLLRFRGHSRGYFVEAISAVDIALWDIAGKALNLPVHRLMMGCNRQQVPVYASSIFWDSPDKMAAVAADLAAKGYRAIKVKIGQGVEVDMSCLGNIRQAIGSGVELMVDANCAYNGTDALRLGRSLERFDIRWFEEPVPPDDLDSYRNISAKLDVALAAGEAEFSLYGIRGLLENGVRIIQPDVARAGGLTEVRRIAVLAQAFHVLYAPHTGASSAVNMAASLQLAAAIPNFMVYEHMVGNNPLADSLLAEPLPTPQNGMITIPSGPGLGIKLDAKAIAEYRIA